MLKTLYTKWPAYESLTPCLWRPGFQISSGSVSRHQHNTSLGQANARFFNSPFLLLFQTLLFSSRSYPSFYLVPFKAFFRLYQLHCSRILKAKEPASARRCLLYFAKLYALQNFTTVNLNCTAAFSCIFLLWVHSAFWLPAIVRPQPLPFPLFATGPQWFERFARLHVLLWGVQLSLQSPNSHQTTQS